MATVSSKKRSALVVPAELLRTWCNGDQGIHHRQNPSSTTMSGSRKEQEQPRAPQQIPQTKAELTLAPHSSHTQMDKQQALGCVTGTMLSILSSRPGQAVRKQSSRAPYKNPKLLHYRSMKRGGERKVLLQQHSEEEFVKFPERRAGDLGQRKMLRLCICSFCVSQESLALHPKLFQFLISLSLSPAHQASQNVIQLSKATTYHSATVFTPSCSVSVPERHTASFFLVPYFNFLS